MNNKVWIDASVWLESYNEKQLQALYQDKKRYENKEKNRKLNNKKSKKK